jgi:hypothetical protein
LIQWSFILLDAYQHMFPHPTACYYICGWLLLVPSYFLKPNKFFYFYWKNRTRIKNGFKNHYISFIPIIITSISPGWIAIDRHPCQRVCAELQHGWFNSMPTKQNTLEKRYIWEMKCHIGCSKTKYTYVLTFKKTYM